MKFNSRRKKSLRMIIQVLSGALIIFALGAGVLLLSKKSLPPGWITVHPPRDVMALTIYQGALWSGGKDGLYRIDPAGGTVLEKIELEEADFSFTTSIISNPLEDQLWIGHQRGLSLWSNKRWKHFNQDNGLQEPRVLSLALDSDRLWIGTADGLAYLNLSNLKINYPEDPLTRKAFSVLYLDSGGDLYAGNGYTKEGGLVHWDGTSWKEITPADGLAHPMVNAILESPEGTIWFGTGFSSQGGLSIRSDQGWKAIKKEDGLAGAKVRYLFEDQSGVIWVGSEFEGIARLGERDWDIFTPENGLAGWEVKAMLQDDQGRLWLGTENGLTRMDYQTWQSFSD